MSKYSKGKKLPKGVSQRKDDGKFIAGFVDKAGKRHRRRFDTMVEADRWLYELYKLCDEAGIKRFCMHAALCGGGQIQAETGL